MAEGPVKLPLTGLCLHPQPPLVQTHTVTITAASNSLPSGVSTTEVPVVPTKTLVYESAKVGAQPGSLSPGGLFAWWKRLASRKQEGLGRTRTELHELQHVKTEDPKASSRVFCVFCYPTGGRRWRRRQRQHHRVQLIGGHQRHLGHNNHHTHLQGQISCSQLSQCSSCTTSLLLSSSLQERQFIEMEHPKH